MVKTPKARHSKTKRDPVTIDLDPASVSRVSDTAEHAPADAPQAAAPLPTEDEATPRDEALPPETSPEGVSMAAQEEREWTPRDEATEEAAEIAAIRAAAEAERNEQERHERAEAAAQAAPPARGGGTSAGVVGGIVGAVLALVVAFLLQWSGVLPAARTSDDGAAGDGTTLQQQVSDLQDKVSQLGSGAAGQDAAALGGRVDGLGEEVAALKESVGKIEQAPADGGQDVQALKDQLADLQTKVQDAAQSAADAGALKERVDRLEQGVQAAQSGVGQADTNAQKLVDLQAQLKQLGDKLAAQQEQPRVALLVAATALKSAVDRGVAFDGELQAYQSVAPGSGNLAALQKYAGQGVPTRAALAEQVPDVATKIVSAGTENDGSDGVVSRLWGSAKSLVVVRPVGQVEGDGVSAIAARFEADVKSGDYAKALDEYGKLPDASKKAAADFADKLKARQAADEIMDKALSGAVKAG